MGDLVWRGGVRGRARLGFIDTVQDLLGQAAAVIPSEVMMPFELAVVDVVGNAIKHTTPATDTHVALNFTFEARSTALTATLREIGAAPFTLTLYDAPMPGTEAESGRGLALASMLLTTLTCQARAGENQWTMRFDLDGGTDTDTDTDTPLSHDRDEHE